MDAFSVIKFPLTTESAMKKIEDNNTLVRTLCMLRPLRALRALFALLMLLAAAGRVRCQTGRDQRQVPAWAAAGCEQC